VHGVVDVLGDVVDEWDGSDVSDVLVGESAGE
jgi:hypothetical protein